MGQNVIATNVPLNAETTSMSDIAAKRAAIVAWREAAIADGWQHKPTYTHEDEDRATSMSRDGFKVMLLVRDLDGRQAKWVTRPEYDICAWGPDGLTVEVPDTYDMEALRTGVRECANCGAKDVDTQRFSFAGRCCARCLPAMRAEHERPGWYD